MHRRKRAGATDKRKGLMDFVGMSSSGVLEWFLTFSFQRQTEG